MVKETTRDNQGIRNKEKIESKPNTKTFSGNSGENSNKNLHQDNIAKLVIL